MTIGGFRLGRLNRKGGPEGHKGPERVQPDEPVMRFADGGDAVSVPRMGEGGKPVNIFFESELPLGSILNFGKGGQFEVVEPSESAQRSGFPPAVYVKRIRTEEYNKHFIGIRTGSLSGEIFDSVQEMPLSDKTKENLNLS